MDAPDKIYIDTDLIAFHILDEKFEGDIEYIRKDALIEWAKEMMINTHTQLLKPFWQAIIDKLNETIRIAPAGAAEPIPITPEILEKNGFEKLGYPGWIIHTHEYTILWRNDYPNVLKIESYTSKYGSFDRFNVNYVHELQHALQLCRISKEIIL